MRKANKETYRKVNLYTIVAVFLLIAVGSIVRVMEAGMGCPDWPKCFGEYIPPTSASQLPEGYQDVFLQKRIEKNERLAGVLDVLGLDRLANRLNTDPDIRMEEEYDSNKAWIEYINRLIGVVIGLFILAYCWYSFRYFQSKPAVVAYSIAGLILVLFQGWIGSLVVSTNLLPGFVSFHMGLAFVLIGMLLYTYHLTGPSEMDFAGNYSRLSFMLLLLLLPQLFLGTQVREQIDAMLFRGLMREDLIGELSVTFYIHRSLSLLLIGGAFYGLYRLGKEDRLRTTFGKIWVFCVGLMLLEAIGGAVMAYFAVPRFVQPIHLLSAAILFGLLYYLNLRASSARRSVMMTV